MKYALVEYSFLTTMTLPEKEEASFEMMRLLFEANYGKKNVSLNTEKKTIHVQMTSAAYLINNSEYNGWKVLGRKKELKPLLEKILPKKVLKKLK